MIETIITCLTVLGVAGLAWDCSRRWASRDSNLRQLLADCDGAILEMNEKVEELERLREGDVKLAVIRRDQVQVDLTQITNTLSTRRTEFEALQTSVADLAALVNRRFEAVDVAVVKLREDYKAEFIRCDETFVAMKHQFDRATGKQALTEAVAPTGRRVY
jgi:hypothetical protein